MNNTAIIIVFIVYMLCMIGVGVYFYIKKTNKNSYLLAGRKLNPWVASMSAQASDMSGWLLTGLPGLAYAANIIGAQEAIWTAIGLLIGTMLNWIITAKRLRVYTEVTSDSQTLPEYFEKRFKDKRGILRAVSSLVILVFFTVYTASMFSAGAMLFNNVFGLKYETALIIGALILVSYVFLGGFMAVSWTDLFQGILMFFTLILVPLFMLFNLSGSQSESLSTDLSKIFSMFPSDTNGVSWLLIISSLGWGLGYFGMPHILVRFMACKDKNTIKPATIIAGVWVTITLFAAVFIGIIARNYLGTSVLENNEQVFMIVVKKLFPSVIAGILLSAILAAIMSTADSQLLVASSAFSNDIYKTVINKKASDKHIMWINRLTIIAVAVVAVIIASNSKSSVFKLVSYAWAGFGASFGPLVLFSLYSKKLTFKGAVASILTGAIVTIVFKYFLSSLGGFWAVYELVPGFILSAAALWIVSLLDKTKNKEIEEDYDKMLSIIKEK